MQPMVSARAEAARPSPAEPQAPPIRALTVAIPVSQPADKIRATPSPRRERPDADGADEGASTLANVEEMLEGFEWRGTAGGAADRIEKRLIGELQAHEAASIHAIVESDDRVNHVVKHLDEAIAELERLDQLISLYRTQLNVRRPSSRSQ